MPCGPCQPCQRRLLSSRSSPIWLTLKNDRIGRLVSIMVQHHSTAEKRVIRCLSSKISTSRVIQSTKISMSFVARFYNYYSLVSATCLGFGFDRQPCFPRLGDQQNPETQRSGEPPHSALIFLVAVNNCCCALLVDSHQHLNDYYYSTAVAIFLLITITTKKP